MHAQLRALPTEDNLYRRKQVRAGRRCQLECVNQYGQVLRCGQERPTQCHVFSMCPVALEQGRMAYRHNSVLLVLKTFLIAQVAAINARRVELVLPKGAINFVSETGKAYAAQRSKECRLAPKSLSEVVSSARDWTVHFDHLGNDAYAYQHYPLEVSATAERPDILLRSRANRTVVAIELTCPDEQAMQKAFDRKSRRYNHLILDGKANNYTVLVMPIEVGVLGYVARSTWNVLRALRFTKSQLATIKCQLEDVARRCTYKMFVHRNTSFWEQNQPLLPANGPCASTAL